VRVRGYLGHFGLPALRRGKLALQLLGLGLGLRVCKDVSLCVHACASVCVRAVACALR
jgi:hypothetical protein